MTRQPEGRLVLKIRNWLLREGAVPYNIHGGDNFQERGIPDLLVCFNGRFVGIEVKQPGGRLSKAQMFQLERIRRAGGIAIAVDSLEEVKLALSELDRIGGQ